MLLRKLWRVCYWKSWFRTLSITGPTKYVLPKTKHTKLDGLSVGNSQSFVCFCVLYQSDHWEFSEKKTTDLSVIQPQSSTQVKEDVLGLLGIEGGLFGLVGRWLVFFFVVSRCGVFLPGRIHRFNDDQCVLSWNVVFSEGLLVVPKCKQFCLKTQTEDGWLFFWGHRSLNPIVSFVPPFFIRMLEFVMLSPANDECFECTRTCRTSSFQIPSVEFLDGRFYFSLRLQGFWSDSIGYLHLQGHVVKGYL